MGRRREVGRRAGAPQERRCDQPADHQHLRTGHHVLRPDAFAYAEDVDAGERGDGRDRDQVGGTRRERKKMPAVTCESDGDRCDGRGLDHHQQCPAIEESQNGPSASRR